MPARELIAFTRASRDVESNRVGKLYYATGFCEWIGVISVIETTRLFRGIRRCLVLLCCAACGPSLNEPASASASGHWTSSDHAGPVFDIVMDISQQADGSVIGTWSSLVSPPHPDCPPDISDKANGTVDGTNTVLGILLSLKGAGDFQGQIDRSAIRGSLYSCGNEYTVTFTLASPVPGS